MRKWLNFRLSEGWHSELERSSKIFFSVYERHRWPVVGWGCAFLYRNSNTEDFPCFGIMIGVPWKSSCVSQWLMSPLKALDATSSTRMVCGCLPIIGQQGTSAANVSKHFFFRRFFKCNFYVLGRVIQILKIPRLITRCGAVQRLGWCKNNSGGGRFCKKFMALKSGRTGESGMDSAPVGSARLVHNVNSTWGSGFGFLLCHREKGSVRTF